MRSVIRTVSAAVLCGAAFLVLLGMAGEALGKDHHHQVRVGKPNGAARVGTAATGHDIYTHARGGLVHDVTLKHPRSTKTHRPSRIVAVGRRGGVATRANLEGVTFASAERHAEGEQEVTLVAAGAQQGAFIGFVFVFTDQSGGQHVVFIWLPLEQVDPQVSNTAVDID
jgi:hypothetical protein